VAITIREADKNDVVNGVNIPRGTPVFLAPGVVNLDQRTWGQDAEQFNPDRWDSLPETISNYSFMTFLQGIPLMNTVNIGTRSCIGRKFAETEMKCLLAVLIGKFTFKEVVPGRQVEKETIITVRPKGGMPLHVHLVNA
jgi:cytochrome P450